MSLPRITRSRYPGRSLFAVVVLGVVAALLATLPTTAAAQPSGPADDDKIRPKLLSQFEQKGEADFWIYFGPTDLSAARKIADWDERGKAVYGALSDAAEQRQAATRELLESEGATYQTFWATNAIKVSAGDQALAESVASLSQVKGIYPGFEVTSEKPKQEKDAGDHAPSAVEWGIADINADDVWSQFGVTGEGITVANIDSGVDWDHPALKSKYRGTAADGSVDHNYNWFDAAGTCPTAPCDTNPGVNHGTHTMGTMVGDDGAGNQIGVAPGANWIAASGCCPSDAALISSGEWMIAPTDLQGQNPDPTKRPDIINNSWGTRQPSNDPFMEDISIAWEAAGMFGIFANGNAGPACQTSGSPGSRVVNYSVGNYQADHSISNLSSRGAGQDGAIKPDISAPGSSVRSAKDGGGYQLLSGTSMATPHVAGTIALLWSAAPALIGDITATRALLDGTAIDTPNSQCGGTDADNNVFGQGRLDALAAMQDAPTGDTGEAKGTVKANGGAAIEGATISFDGEADRSVTTDASGAYSVRLVAGSYQATASAFGYLDQTKTVQVAANGTVTTNFDLAKAESTTVSGTVTDGSGQGWPLYAQVIVDGDAPDTFTDPETGEYSLELPVGATYDVTFNAQLPGYLPHSAEVTPTAATTLDAAVLVDETTCAANGYHYVTEGVQESFDDTTTPAGWEIVDTIGQGNQWRFDNPKSRVNLTGGTGGFAIADSDFAGSGKQMDTSLITPSLDFTDLTEPAVGFKQDYRNSGDKADVDVSIDGGQTWQTVLAQTTSKRGPLEEFIQLPMAAGQADVKVRFHYYAATYDWWWELDDVFVGNRSCDPTGGGLVVGNVRDDDGAGVNDAQVTDLDAPEITTKTVATPDDKLLDDGFYWVYVPEAGTATFQAKKAQYGSAEQEVTVADGTTVRADFALGAAKITVTPTKIKTVSPLGGPKKSATFKVTNNGTSPAELEFGEQEGDFTIQRSDGSRVSQDDVLAEEGAPVRTIDAPTSLAASGESDKSNDAAVELAEEPWMPIADLPSTIMDNRAVNADGIVYSIGGTPTGSGATDAVYAYDPATLTWSTKAPVPSEIQAPSVGVISGQIIAAGGWQGSSAPGTGTFLYDPAADTWSTGAAAPNAVSAAGHGVVDGKLYSVGGCTTADCVPMSNKVSAYDPASDTWTALADYPISVAFAVCGGVDGRLYCTGGNGGTGGTAATYEYDPAGNTWSELPDAPSATWASGGAAAGGMLVVNGGVHGTDISNETFGFNVAEGQWVDLPNSTTPRYRGTIACGVYKVGGSSGSFNAESDAETLPGFDCATSAADVSWMSINKESATLAPGASVTVKVTMNPKVAQPGRYAGGVTIKDDAPGTAGPVRVIMVVKAPKNWGKLTGIVRARSCQGQFSRLADATVQVQRKGVFKMTFATGADGSYAYWIPAKASPLRVIAAKDGYAPKTTQVTLRKGKVVTADFNLRATGCS